MAVEEKPAGLKRPLSEVEDAAESLALDERIAKEVTENTGKPSSRPASKKPRVEERRSIFVRSLPPVATNETLTDFFSQYFPVKHATVITDHKTKESRGYGFVTFADVEDAQQAKASLDKKLWDGRSLRIDIAEPRHRKGNPEDKPAAPPGKPTNDDNRKPPKLIVRNLPWSVKTEEQLSHLFRSFGLVKYADLPKAKGKLRGFGFVTIRGQKNAEKALETMNGKELDGRILAVDWAVNKESWEAQQKEPEKLEKTDKKSKAEDDDDQTSDDATSDEEDDEVDGADGKSKSASKPKDKELDDDLKNFFKNHMTNMEDESDENDDDEEEDDDDKEEDVEEVPEAAKEKVPLKKLTTDNSSTLFIRNLPFTATDEQVKGFFDYFGKVRYARVVKDKATEKPAGTGFVCFFNEADAKACIKGAPRAQAPAAPNSKHSILQDENADPDGHYTLDGRLLQVAQAVNKETATNLADSAMAKRREKDKRRLFLLSEGAITPRSPLFKLLGQSELQMRQASAAQRKKLVEKNPSLHLSLTRLALRNIPRNIGSKELKDLARKAIVGFATDVREGRRVPLSKEENARDTKEAKDKERERRLKGKGIVRQAKIVFETNDGSKVDEKSGAGKSRGYGFIEYTSHHWALMGLRYLNGHQLEGDNGRKQRLIVEFAIENAQVVQRRREVEGFGARSAERKAAKDQKAVEETKGGKQDDDNQRTRKILRDNKEARGKGGRNAKNKSKKGGKPAEDKPAPAAPVAAPADGKSEMQHKLIARKRLMRKKKANARG
ncbi:nucleolar protein 4 [Geosmithia morbida]|uniref:Nucleolar protein 4 n=1 Tax=Geosmithia morbida TaxID=1094350 RepID=A0A9P4YR73_9HYPO|nr:nucleolar protein 4 [Geosmithia morbida]KAF4120294.1 nucleolar protein 4 [Geosmithia morbida]